MKNNVGLNARSDKQNAAVRAAAAGSALCRALAVMLCFLFAAALILPQAVLAEEDGTLKEVRVAMGDSGIFIRQDSRKKACGGYAFEYIQRVASYAGWRVKYVPCGSYLDCLEAVDNGKADLLYEISHSEQADAKYLFPDTFMGVEDYCLYALQSNTDIVSGDVSLLDGKIVGVTEGSSQNEALDAWCSANGITFDIRTYRSTLEKMDALRNGEIDLDYEISLLADTDFSAIKKVTSSTFYLVANKDRQDLIDDINRAVDRIDEVDPFFLSHLNEKYFSKSVINRTVTEDERKWIANHAVTKVGYMEDYLPFSKTGEKGEVEGIIKPLMALLADNLGVRNSVRFEYIPFTDSATMFKALQDGVIDEAFPAFAGVPFAIENGISVSSEVISLSADLVCRGGINERTTERIAVNVHDRQQAHYVASSFPDALIIKCESIDECLEAVKSGSAGATVVNSLRTTKLLEDARYESLTYVRLAEPCAFAFAVREGNTALLSLVNRAIAAVDKGYVYNLAFDYYRTEGETSFHAFFADNKDLIMVIVMSVLLVIAALLGAIAVISARRKKESAEASEAKSRFLFNMSHDIRTPMNAVIGYTDIAMKLVEDQPKVYDTLTKARQSENLLCSLLDSVLEMKEIENGGTELNEVPGKVYYSFVNIESSMQMLAKEKGVTLSFCFGSIKDQYVYVDADKTNRIFINIISNALQYTGQGGEVRVSCAQVGREGMTGFYRYVIEDNGVGMSEEFQQHLFEEFTRENNTTATGVAGPGLGLSIAKSLIAVMNGKIEFHSKQGKGTTFTITFPFRLQEAERTSQYTDPITRDTMNTYAAKGEERVNGRPGAKAAPLENKRVLLVEDNEMNREIETFVLENEKIVVEVAKDGADAVNIVKEKGPDYFAAILMDIQMPVMNGYEATKAIREMFPDSKLPIIAVSANAFQEDKDASFAAGMNAHVSKPLNPTELVQVLTEKLKEAGRI